VNPCVYLLFLIYYFSDMDHSRLVAACEQHRMVPKVGAESWLLLTGLSVHYTHLYLCSPIALRMIKHCVFFFKIFEKWLVAVVDFLWFISKDAPQHASLSARCRDCGQVASR
jgi:hypothetical protein